MIIKKISENFNNIESIFYFLNVIKPFSNDNKNQNLDFLKSLNLTEVQYIKLAEIMEDYGHARYQDGCTNEYEE
jgi:hypothetical protein